MLELPVDPYDGISRRIAEVLDGFIIRDDYFASTDAQDALEMLVAAWHELEGPADNDRWTASYGGRDWVVVRDSTGRLIESTNPLGDLHFSGGIAIPSAVVSALQTVLEARSADERYIGLDSIDMINLKTRAVYIDDEKLLGHLFLAHHVPFEDLAQSSDDRLAQHAAMHRRVPGHGTWTADDEPSGGSLTE
jgi:hypothetical protein